MEKSLFSGKGFVEPQGAPRGLLMYYVLHKLSSKSAYGYEISRDIESKSGGFWRPGPSSVYPLLKKLESSGLIEAKGDHSDAGSHRVYSITDKGRAYLSVAKERFRLAGMKWESVGRIFIELVDPSDVPSMISRKSGLDLIRELIEKKIGFLPKREARYMLEEYRLNLRRQLEWVEDLIAKLEAQDQAGTVTQRGAESV